MSQNTATLPLRMRIVWLQPFGRFFIHCVFFFCIFPPLNQRRWGVAVNLLTFTTFCLFLHKSHKHSPSSFTIPSMTSHDEAVPSGFRISSAQIPSSGNREKNVADWRHYPSSSISGRAFTNSPLYYFFLFTSVSELFSLILLSFHIFYFSSSFSVFPR